MYIGLYKTPNKALSCLVLSCLETSLGGMGGWGDGGMGGWGDGGGERTFSQANLNCACVKGCV